MAVTPCAIVASGLMGKGIIPIAYGDRFEFPLAATTARRDAWVMTS
jgi:hypothetical protein